MTEANALTLLTIVVHSTKKENLKPVWMIGYPFRWKRLSVITNSVNNISTVRVVMDVSRLRFVSRKTVLLKRSMVLAKSTTRNLAVPCFLKSSNKQ